MYQYLKEWQERTSVDIDAVLQVGDFGIYQTIGNNRSQWNKYWEGKVNAPIPTWVVPGNHEGWPELEQWMLQPDRVANIRLLPDGGITEILSEPLIRVGSIWGNFSRNSWNNPAKIKQVRQHDKRSVKTMHVLRDSVEHLQTLGEFDILLTHDCGFGDRPIRQPDLAIKMELGLAPDEKASGCPGFNEIRKSSKCKFHFYGHFHSLMKTYTENCAIIGLNCIQYNPWDSLYIMEV